VSADVKVCVKNSEIINQLEKLSNQYQEKESNEIMNLISSLTANKVNQDQLSL